MSLGHEYEAEFEFEKDFPFGLPGDYWYSKSGRIKVSDMTDSHIMNCMRIVGEDDPWYSHFKKELDKRHQEIYKKCIINIFNLYNK